VSIAFEHVSFSYNDQHEALRDIDFTLEDGEFLGIIGHTGSGKSTITQLMNALLIPSSGRVLVDGMDTHDRKVRRTVRMRVGLAFQYPEAQLFAQTVAQDVAFGPRNLGLDDAEIERRAHTALERVGFAYDEIASCSPFDLSGGQQRRVALAGILAMEPSTLVLDEPAAGMDPATVTEIRSYLRRLNNQGLTIVLVSHSMEETAELCSRVFVLDHGSIHMQGTPGELFTDENAKELHRINLGIPRATKFALELADRGLELSGTILDEAHLVEALLARYEETMGHDADFQRA
jgi:energy-coupling factor transport system ATP-binding protein